jgi:LysR family transcriptional activator of nhaA
MLELNYHHLRYVWAVEREGGVTAAARALHVAQPTVSAQLRTLEADIGTPLFHREGRRLVLTETGRLVYRYAEQIFGLGAELEAHLAGKPAAVAPRLRVGIADVIPKLVAHEILKPVLRATEALQLTCFEGKPQGLFAQLITHDLDAVISDEPVAPHHHVRAFNHLLGECGVAFYAQAPLARRLRPGFPGSLSDAPCYLPTPGTALRRNLDRWLDAHDLHPRIRAEFEDSALLKVFGAAGGGIFAAPTVIEKQVCRQYGVERVGRTEDVRERFYVVTIERRVRSEAVAALVDSARRTLFD